MHLAEQDFAMADERVSNLARWTIEEMQFCTRRNTEGAIWPTEGTMGPATLPILAISRI